jgi:O-antigen ligase
MAPQSTWLGALSLLPPLAVFLAVITLNWRERRLLSLLAIGVAVASAFLGLTQLVQGPTSPLRFFEVTNESSPVGFFANVNHFAALLYSAVPLAAAWLATGIGAMPFTRKRSREVADAASVVGIVTASVALLVLVAVDVVACSRAGVILMLVALFGSLALTGEPSRQLKNLASTRVIIGVVALALLFSGNSALFRLLDRFDVDRLADVRDVIAHNTVAAASTLMPVGAGVGAFVPIYAMFEKPQELLPGVYVNHAHNDFLELWLETGVAGPLLLCAFLYWLVRRAARAWGPSYPGSYAIDKSLIRAAILIIALLLGHSLVDYPLRTSGVMAIMAFACALLIDPVPQAAAADAPPIDAVKARRRSTANPAQGGVRRRDDPRRTDRPW